MNAMLRSFLKWVCRIIIWIYAEVEMEGRENIPEEGAILIVANHRSLADPPLIALATPRPIYFMGKSELFSSPFSNWLFRNLLVFPVNPRSADRKALRQAEKLLIKGEAVCMFPEGQLTETGELQDVNGGAVMIALHAEAPILPIGLVGTEELVPYGSLKPQRAWGKISVRIGKPIPLDALSGGGRGKEALRHGMRVLKEEISKLTEMRNSV